MQARRMLAERVDVSGREDALGDPATDLTTVS